MKTEPLTNCYLGSAAVSSMYPGEPRVVYVLMCLMALVSSEGHQAGRGSGDGVILVGTSGSAATWETSCAGHKPRRESSLAD